MNKQIASCLLAAAGVAVGVVGITMGGASSAPTAAECAVPGGSATDGATGAANDAVDGATAGSVPTAPSGTDDGNGNGSGGAGDGSGGTGSGTPPLIDVDLTPPSAPSGDGLPLPLPGLPAPGGDAPSLGGLHIDADAHADPNDSNVLDVDIEVDHDQ
jgi:hypothetical protein